MLSFQAHDDASCRPYVPAAERDRLLRFVHAHPLGGHFGKDKTYAKLRRSFFWPNMQKESNNFVDACQECALKRGHGRRITPPLKPIPPPSSAMDKVAMDILKLPKTPDGNEYALVITCLLTGYINIKAMPNQKAETVVQAFLESVLPHGGIPLRVLTDQGRQFTGNLMTALAERLHFEQLFTSAFHPKSDGISERNNATLIQMASKFLKGRQDDWDRLLPLMTYAYNSATSSRTGTSPFFLMFGREPRPIHDGSLMTHQLNPTGDFNAFFADLPMSLRLAWKLAEDTSIAQKEKDKRAYDKKTKPVPFQVGDWVLVYQPALKNSKLASPYEGPGKIIRLYPEDAPTNADVQIPGKRKVRKCNVDRLSAAREALIPKDDPPPQDSLIPLPPRGRGRPARFRPSTPPPPATTHPADPNLELEASSDDGAAGVVYTAETEDVYDSLLGETACAPAELHAHILNNPALYQQQVTSGEFGEDPIARRVVNLSDHVLYPCEPPATAQIKASVLQRYLSPANFHHYMQEAQSAREYETLRITTVYAGRPLEDTLSLSREPPSPPLPSLIPAPADTPSHTPDDSSSQESSPGEQIQVLTSQPYPPKCIHSPSPTPRRRRKTKAQRDRQRRPMCPSVSESSDSDDDNGYSTWVARQCPPLTSEYPPPNFPCGAEPPPWETEDHTTQGSHNTSQHHLTYPRGLHGLPGPPPPPFRGPSRTRWPYRPPCPRQLECKPSPDAELPPTTASSQGEDWSYWLSAPESNYTAKALARTGSPPPSGADTSMRTDYDEHTDVEPVWVVGPLCDFPGPPVKPFKTYPTDPIVDAKLTFTPRPANPSDLQLGLLRCLHVRGKDPMWSSGRPRELHLLLRLGTRALHNVPHPTPDV